MNLQLAQSFPVHYRLDGPPGPHNKIEQPNSTADRTEENPPKPDVTGDTGDPIAAGAPEKPWLN